MMANSARLKRQNGMTPGDWELGIGTSRNGMENNQEVGRARAYTAATIKHDLPL